ncbi:5'-nucleotidase C-terminal domain-containing protein [Clostridium sp. MSJ-4]|uniref:5'-nucleotidase C-terminal domain-containing protein n=1 Tax=Clostridium simiarum TaxID=2841506 RepID=A0ABS6EW36_9CLOT|nr:5'-nucleotidase C-terminal domain-containing protein [Clostridium simiarum]MBU5590421.1 5'-nucleotidase C-terminal domain-containing protein [Clostridium simiarum]
MFRKKLTTILVVAAMTLGVIAPTNLSVSAAENDITDKSKSIQILSFNDFHGSVEESGKNIGAAKLAAEIRRLKGENPNTIVVSGGDLYQGSAISNLKKGEPVTEFLKSVGMEVSAVGNHEFDWGYKLIPGWAKDGNFDFLATNIYNKSTGNPVEWAKPYKVIERDGKKIAFIGIATPETAYKTKPENVSEFEFKDPVESVNTWAEKIRREENVDAVIALTHLGSNQNSSTKEITGEAADLAKNAKGIDAVISAHSHQFVDGVVNNIPVVQAGNNGRGLAKLVLNFDAEGKLVKVDNSVDQLYKRVKELPEDQEAKAIVEKFKNELQPILGEVLATLDTDLTHDRDEGLSVLGQFTTKLMAEASGAQIGITNGGGVRAPIEKGTITMGNMYQVFPFDNTLVTMKLKGSDLKRVIEHGIMPDGFGWGQFYGIKVYYDKDAKAGERITSMRLLDGTPIDMDKYYTVVTNDFMYDKGDNYDFSGAIDVVDTGEPIRDALVKIIKDMKHVSYKYEQHLVAGVDTTEDVVETVDTNLTKEDNKVTTLPETGSLVGESELIVAGTLVTALGAFMFFNEKRRKKNNSAA